MIMVNIDVVMAKRKMSAGELAERIGITAANLSILKIIKPRRYDSPLWRLYAENLTAK